MLLNPEKICSVKFSNNKFSNSLTLPWLNYFVDELPIFSLIFFLTNFRFLDMSTGFQLPRVFRFFQARGNPVCSSSKIACLLLFLINKSKFNRSASKFLKSSYCGIKYSKHKSRWWFLEWMYGKCNVMCVMWHPGKTAWLHYDTWYCWKSIHSRKNMHFLLIISFSRKLQCQNVWVAVSLGRGF